MLWYPVKAYGDFKLKFQFREGRTDGGCSNGGVFVRFPDPRVPVAQRPDACARTGSAARRRRGSRSTAATRSSSTTARTASRRRRARSTTSTTNDIGEIGEPSAVASGTTTRSRCVGQHYTIFRNGEVINEFDNAPGIDVVARR